MLVFFFFSVTAFLSYPQYCEPGSNELRKYSNSYVNKLLFEDCIRNELMKSHKIVKIGPVSHLSQTEHIIELLMLFGRQIEAIDSSLSRTSNYFHLCPDHMKYTDMWVYCAESTGGDFENSNLIFSPPLKFKIIQLWKKMGDLLDVLEKDGRTVNDECKKILLYQSIRACLPTIKAYSLRYREGDVIAFVSFVKCISSSLSPCGNETRKFLTSVIKRNVKYIFYLSDDKEEKLKECLEMVNESEINDCAAGLYEFLSSFASEKIVFEVQVLFPSDFKCIHQAFKYCDSESVKIISSLVQDSMKVTLFNSKEIPRLSSQLDVFTLMPDDVYQIQVCLTLSSLHEINECCPELACILENIAKGAPIAELSFSVNHQYSGCLGYALRKCSGSMRFVINKVMLGLYGVDLKIPFNRNSILSLPATISKEISECLRLDAYILEDCCGQLVEAIVKVLRDESLPFPLQEKRNCVQPCIKDSIYRCSEGAGIWIIKLILGIKEAYDKLSALNILYFPKTPPYALPPSLFQKLDSCIKTVTPNAVEACCPGILRVINAYKSNESLPLGCLIPKNCKYECLLHTTDACQSKSATLLRAFVAFAIKVFEGAQAPSNVLRYRNRYPVPLTEAKNLQFIPHPSANNLGGSSMFSQTGTAQVLGSNPQGRIVFIPSFLREQIRVCMYLMEKKLLDFCWEGMYDFMVFLSYGLRPSPLGSVHAKDIRLCLSSAFQPCSVSSVLVINNVLKPFVNAFDMIIPSRQQSISISRIDDVSKASVKSCLKRITDQKLDNCFEDFFNKIIEILEPEQSVSKIAAGVSGDNRLKESFKVCSMKARLLISTIAFDHLGIMLDIPLFYEKACINITEFISNDEMLDLQNCLASANEDEVDACEPGLSLLLSQIAKGYMTVSQQYLKPNRHCLGNIFKHCSVRSRLLIMDVVKFVTGIVIDIPLSLKNRTRRDISGVHEHSIVDQQYVQQCFKTLHKDNLDSCVPGLYNVIKDLAEDKLPLNTVALKPLEHDCLESNFFQCSYRSRVLIKDLIYDYARLNVVIPLLDAPEGFTGEFGPPIAAIQECFSTIDIKSAEKIIPGFLRAFHETFVRQVENSGFKLLPENAMFAMACLKELFTSCEVPIKMYLLQKIAAMNNIKLNVQIEKHFLPEEAPESCLPKLVLADHLPGKSAELVVVINNSGIHNRDKTGRFPREANPDTKEIKTLRKDDDFGEKEISGGLPMSELFNRKLADSHTSNDSEMENAENRNSENIRNGTSKAR